MGTSSVWPMWIWVMKMKINRLRPFPQNCRLSVRSEPSTTLRVMLWTQRRSSKPIKQQTASHIAPAALRYWGKTLSALTAIVVDVNKPGKTILDRRKAGYCIANQDTAHQISHHWPFSDLTLLVERQEGHPDCKNWERWFVGGDDLTGTLHVL